MAKPIKDLNNSDFNYSKQMGILIAYIKEHWNVSARPKGYKEFCENYTDFKGMEEEDQQTIINAFEGFDDSTAGSFSFPIRTSLPQVAYDDKCQGREPLETLLGAVFAYGMRYGMRYEEVSNRSDTHYRLHSIEHCISQIKWEKDDPEMQETYRNELNDLFNVLIDHMDTCTKYELIQDKILKERVKPLIVSYCKHHFNRSKEPGIIVKTHHKRLNDIWETLFRYNVGHRSKEHPVYTELKKELKEKGIDLSRKKTKKDYEHIYILKPCKKTSKKGNK